MQSHPARDKVCTYSPAGRHDQCWQLAQMGTPSARSKCGQHGHALTSVSGAADHLQGVTASQPDLDAASLADLLEAQMLQERQHLMQCPDHLSPQC